MIHSTDENLLDIADLTKIFTLRQGFSTTKLVAVDKASFFLKASQPEIVALAGESGSGKTTVAQMILGLTEPTSGIIRYKSKDLTKLTRQEKRSWFLKEVQPIFQNPFATFSPLKRIETYLFETAFNYNVVEKENVNQYVDDILGLVGLSLAEISGRYPNELSGGQAQRVSVARALITAPSLLVADEPVSMVDASLRMSIVNLFRQLKDEKAVSVLYITHDLATAYYAADRIAIMLGGWIVESGSVEKVLGQPLHPYTQNLKQSIPDPDPDRKWEGQVNLAVLETDEFTNMGCKYASRCPEVMEICKQKIPTDFLVENRTVKCFLYEDNNPT